MSARPTFEESRRSAYGLLGDAADELRGGDWSPMPNDEQREALGRFFDAVGAGKEALDDAARAADRTMEVPR